MMIRTKIHKIDVSNVIQVYKHTQSFDRLIKKANKNGDVIWYITGTSRLFKVDDSIIRSGYWVKEDYEIEETEATKKYKQKYPEDFLWKWKIQKLVIYTI